VFGAAPRSQALARDTKLRITPQKEFHVIDTWNPKTMPSKYFIVRLDLQSFPKLELIKVAP
jgi:hypothetical protein